MQDQRQEAERFVTALYRGVLRREPDEAGLGSYVAAIVSGDRTHAEIAEEFSTCQELKAQTGGKLFVPPGHFYSPIVDPAEGDRHLATLEAGSTPECIPGIHIDRAEMRQMWNRLLPYFNEMPFSGATSNRYRYAFDNPSYSWGDGSVLHAFLRLLQPKRIIEVGSGWSSACTVDTVEHFFDQSCELTFIEPYPALLLELIGSSAARVRILDKRVQDVPLPIFEELQAGDILFIDSTHVLRTGSDVCFELFEVLPRLAPGVVVHIHDMFWPFEYPRSWVVDENRSWNECYALRAFLLNTASWRVLFFNDYFSRLERSMIKATYPNFLLNSGGALWLQRDSK